MTKYIYADLTQTRKVRVRISLPENINEEKISDFGLKVLRQNLYQNKISFEDGNDEAEYIASISHDEITEKAVYL